jgi:hypothetical protein
VDLDETVGCLLDQGAAAAAAEQLLTTVLTAGERLADLRDPPDAPEG